MAAYRNLHVRLAALLCAAIAFTPSIGSAQSSLDDSSRAARVLDSMPHAKTIGEVALSPDSGQVAYIVDDELWVVPAQGGPSRPVTIESKRPLRDVAWSADSKRIVFIADLPGDAPS